MRNRVLLFAAAVLATLGLAAVPSAGADPTATASATRQQVTGQDAQAGCSVSRYGYGGTAMCGTHILDVNWNPGGTARLESFVISTNRTIWHAWPGSGGWKVMPGNGHADDTDDAWWSGGNRIFSVWVTGSGYWCTTDPAGTASWNGWRRC
ncbi:hypothetical protein ACWGE0_13005 [Lentzea sp. NPDC054927]